MRYTTLDIEVKDVSSRLTKLYDALETGKLELNHLAPRIKELKARQDDLFKSRVLLEADMTLHGVQHVDADQVKSYCSDLRSLLAETDIVKSVFIRGKDSHRRQQMREKAKQANTATKATN